uniref:Uncharacterized protein n=1 Tax=Cajanus cajan TaxID=3821 RepID=A0A151RBM6_CAJCA|nr:hypothetical protein KK1_038685 [Cajanus cajan]
MDSFCREHVVCYEGDEIVVCEPYVDGEPVCIRSSSVERFTFCYTTLISKLKVRWPLTECEKGVLQSLNVTPTQFHPNSWAFVRGFEILCSGLGIRPTASKFFYFFDSRVFKRNSWVSVSGVVNRGLLSLFQSSYKGFKKSYFRIRCTPGNENLLKGYPLYFPDASSTEYSTTIDHIWRGRVAALITSFGELARWRNDVDAAVWDPRFCERIAGLNSRKEAFDEVGAYLKEAWEELGPSFLESMSNVKGQEGLENSAKEKELIMMMMVMHA